MKIPFLNLFRARDKPRDAVSAATTFFFGSSASGKSFICDELVRNPLFAVFFVMMLCAGASELGMSQ